MWTTGREKRNVKIDIVKGSSARGPGPAARHGRDQLLLGLWIPCVVICES